MQWSRHRDVTISSLGQCSLASLPHLCSSESEIIMLSCTAVYLGTLRCGAALKKGRRMDRYLYISSWFEMFFVFSSFHNLGSMLQR